MQKIFAEHISIRRAPKNLKKKDLHLFKNDFAIPIKATTIEIFKKVDILRDSIFNRSELKFHLHYSHIFFVSTKRKIIRLLLYFGRYQEINKGIWIIDNWSIAYFHWLTDALPRLVASENFRNSHLVVLPNHYKKVPFIIQSLELLNVEFRFFSNTQRLHVTELIVPSHTAPTGNYNREIINNLRDKFKSKYLNKPDKKIFISRQKASKRKIINEDKLVVVLKSYDFEIHYFEDYSFSEQVNLMQHTSYLIGLHGAGLANMLFMPKKGKVLELRNQDEALLNCYFSLASDLGHDYYYLSNQSNSKATYIADIYVDLNELKKILELK